MKWTKRAEWVYRHILFPMFALGRWQAVELNRFAFGLLGGNSYIAIDELQSLLVLMDNVDPRKLLIIDARRQDEYEYSHIKGAINIHYEFKEAFIPGQAKKAAKRVYNALPEDMKDNKDLKVVVYCGVGLRSNLLGRKLRKKYGYRNVRVLKGALYEWVNRNLPLYNSDGERLAREDYFVKAQHWLATTVIVKENTFTSEEQRLKRKKARQQTSIPSTTTTDLSSSRPPSPSTSSSSSS